jgi:hypothetical protein
MLLERQQFLIIVVKAFATTTLHCCGSRFTEGIDVEKISIQPGSAQVASVLSSGSTAGASQIAEDVGKKEANRSRGSLHVCGIRLLKLEASYAPRPVRSFQPHLETQIVRSWGMSIFHMLRKHFLAIFAHELFGAERTIVITRFRIIRKLNRKVGSFTTPSVEP